VVETWQVELPPTENRLRVCRVRAFLALLERHPEWHRSCDTARPVGATRCTMFATAMLLAFACAKPAPPVYPGTTEIAVSSVVVAPRAGEQIELPYKLLYEWLGLRAKTGIRPGRPFNEFRLAEDRRRVLAFMHDEGHLDAEVGDPELLYSADHSQVAVTWRVHEGPAYSIASVEILGAPPEHAAMLRAMVPFTAGDPVDLVTYRPIRRALAERLQDEGYGHARGYSRMFVDRTAKTVAWFYYLDPGPKTRIGSIQVVGSNRVPAEMILARTKLASGGAYSTAEKRRAELALLDSGAFASATVLTDADIQTGPPEYPDTGGVLAAEQVDTSGNLVPRKLSDELSVRVVVVEAPARQMRAELGIEADPSRVDAYAGMRVMFRNLFAPQHHLVVEGNVGYGWFVGEDDPAKGVYGNALLQYVHPSWITDKLDLRVSARWRDTLYPSAMLREVAAGPGIRSTITPGVFFDVDALYRFGRQLGLPALEAMSVTALGLPSRNDSSGAELVASVVADRRNDAIEPTDGWMLSARGSYSPGGPLGDHRWLQAVGDARGFIPLSLDWSVGARVTAGAVGIAGSDGIPLGPRLFGGGAYGMRGFSRDHLSPAACAEMSTSCDVLVGGRSLVESSVELRFLPFRKLYGAAMFADVGGAGAAQNPFASGVSAAFGAGLRARTWYLPVAIDLSYRLVEENEVGAALDRLLVFFRVGEAF
jgi:outer membrane translocation and assembly module TamA